jgi:hypothetical protein
MPNEPRENRIRQRLTITVSPEVHDYLKNRVGNVSRFLDALAKDAISGIQPAIFILSQKQMDRAGIEPAASSMPRKRS